MIKSNPLFVVCAAVSLTTLTALKINTAFAASNGILNVKFVGLKSSNGQICLNLFSGPKGFPDGKNAPDLKAARCAPISQQTASITFNNLPYGNYAIAAVHDTNGDTRLNSNILGIPKEGVGFSNNPRIRTSAPSFVQSQFLVSGAKTELQIQMRYF